MKKGNFGLCSSTNRIFFAAVRRATKSVSAQPCFLDQDPNHISLDYHEWHHDNWYSKIKNTYIFIIYTHLMNLFEAKGTKLMINIHCLDASKAQDPRRTVAWSYTRLILQFHITKLWFFQIPTVVQY
jgi:hypothetical protein